MLERILKLKTIIRSILNRTENSHHLEKNLSGPEYEKIENLCLVLEPFYLVTVKLSTQKFATQSIIIPAIDALYNSVISYKF